MRRLSKFSVVMFFLQGGLVLAQAPILPPSETSHVFVSSFGTNEVHVFSADGSYLFRFSHPDLRFPRGLVFSANGELHAASQGLSRILVFRDDGTYVRQYAGGDLTSPTSLARGPEGQIFAASFGKNEILVFEDDVFQWKFTAEGLRGPNCIAFAPTGDIYVASQLSNEVFRFSSTGEFVGSFSGGGLSSPMGVAIWGEEVFISGGASHSVVIFDFEGNYLRALEGSFQHAVLSGAQGVAFDMFGNLSVSSFYTGRAGSFSPDGAELFTFDDSGMDIARSIAFLPRSSDSVFRRGDFNEDGLLDVGDAVAILVHLFSQSRPDACRDAGDTNDDGVLELTDGVVVLEHLFLGDATIPSPFPNPGTDPTVDELTCR